MGSGIAPSEEPDYLGKCEYCDVDIFSDEEHYELPDGALYCSIDCLAEDFDKYHVFGEVD